MGIFDWLFGGSKNKTEGNYKDDKTEGLFKTYHKNGQLKTVIDHIDNKGVIYIKFYN